MSGVRQPRRDLTVAVALGVVLLLVDWIAVAPLGTGDEGSYLNVARHPWHFVDVVPFSYRIGVPYLARLVDVVSPLGLVGAFRLLAALGFVAVVAVLVLWVHRGLGRPLTVAVLVGVLYGVSYGGAYNMHHAVQVGIFEQLVLLVGIIAVWHRRLGWLLVVLFVGSWFKESTLLLVPAELVMAYACRDRDLRRVGATVAAAVVPWLALHTVVLAGAPTFGDFLELQRHAGGYQRNPTAGVVDWLERTLLAFGAWVPLTVYEWRYVDRRARWLLLVVPLFLAQTVTATTFERVIIGAFPVLVIFAATALDRMSWPARVAVVGWQAGCIFVLSHWNVQSNLELIALSVVLATMLALRAGTQRTSTSPEASGGNGLGSATARR